VPGAALLTHTGVPRAKGKQAALPRALARRRHRSCCSLSLKGPAAPCHKVRGLEYYGKSKQTEQLGAEPYSSVASLEHDGSTAARATTSSTPSLLPYKL